MKLTNWQLLAALAGLLTAIICAHVFAPGSVDLVVSLVTTAFGVLFLQRQDPPGPPSPPKLTMLSGGGILSLLIFLAACGDGLKSIDEINNPSDDVVLAKCRADARAEMYLTGDKNRAWSIYLACTSDAGLR